MITKEELINMLKLWDDLRTSSKEEFYNTVTDSSITTMLHSFDALREKFSCEAICMAIQFYDEGN